MSTIASPVIVINLRVILYNITIHLTAMSTIASTLMWFNPSGLVQLQDLYVNVHHCLLASPHQQITSGLKLLRKAQWYLSPVVNL